MKERIAFGAGVVVLFFLLLHLQNAKMEEFKKLMDARDIEEQEIVTGEVAIQGPPAVEPDRYWEGYWDGYVKGVESGAESIMFGVAVQKITGEPKTFGVMVEEAVAQAKESRDSAMKMNREVGQ